MDLLLDFGRGPLFRLAIALAILGLIRQFALTFYGMAEALHHTSDRTLPWWDMTRRTFAWLLPLGTLWRSKPVYSLVSFLFHIGLLVVPLTLAAHIGLWERSSGLAWWPALPQPLADRLTLLVLVAGPLLFLARLLIRHMRQLSRLQDFLWPLLLTVPFLSGYLCANASLSATAYRSWMLVHVYSADLILILIPFTKIAHCVLLPLSQYAGGIAWKFPKGAGAKVVATLRKKESWV